MFIRPVKRGYGPMGSGAFGAKRSGGRKHRGEDKLVKPGNSVYSHVEGVVTKIGRPYSPSNKNKKARLKTALRYIEVTDSRRNKHRFFYVEPIAELGDVIYRGSVLGQCQNLNKIWLTMRNHVHYEVKSQSGEYLDPNRFW